MSSHQIRKILFLSASAIALAVLAFIYILNINQPEELQRTFLGYIGLLGLFSIAAFAVFFFAGSIFHTDGSLENRMVITVMLTILIIVQAAFAFANYAYRQAQISSQAYYHARTLFSGTDWTADNVSLDQQLGDLPEEIDFIYILNSGGNPVYLTPGYGIEDLPEVDAPLERFLFPLRGLQIGMHISKAHSADITRSILLELTTVLVVSQFFAYELVLFALTYIKRKKSHGDTSKNDMSPSAYAYIRQFAFLFFFASKMAMSFLPVMASELAGNSGQAGGIASSVPLSAETLFTCVAIFLTSELIIRRGWKLPFVFGLIIVTTGTFLSLLAETMPLFLVARAVVGLGYGFCWMTLRNLSLLGRNDAEQSHGFSLLNAGIYAGINCGSIMGSIMAQVIGYSRVLFVSACFTILCIFMVMMVKNTTIRRQTKETHIKPVLVVPPVRRLRDSLHTVSFILLMILPASIAVSFSGYFLPLYSVSAGKSIADIGRVQLIYGLIIIYVGPHISKFLSQKNGSSFRVNLLYSFLLATALICFGLTHSFVMAVVAVGIIAFADGFGFGAQNSYFLRLPMISRLPTSRSLSVLSFIKKMSEMLGPLAFAVAIGFPGGSGVLWMGLLFLAALIIAVLTTRFKAGFAQSEPCSWELVHAGWVKENSGEQ
jgi:predicted MFS family arabinose efflux permease